MTLTKNDTIKAIFKKNNTFFILFIKTVEIWAYYSTNCVDLHNLRTKKMLIHSAVSALLLQNRYFKLSTLIVQLLILLISCCLITQQKIKGRARPIENLQNTHRLACCCRNLHKFCCIKKNRTPTVSLKILTESVYNPFLCYCQQSLSGQSLLPANTANRAAKMITLSAWIEIPCNFAGILQAGDQHYGKNNGDKLFFNGFKAGMAYFKAI